MSTLTKPTVLADIIHGRKPITVDELATVAMASKVMAQASKGAILVTRGQRLTGLLTERDMVVRVLAAGRDPETTPVAEVMTVRLVTGHPQETHTLALRKMVTANCRHLPIVEGTKVVGMVSRRELMALEIESLEEELERHEPASLFI